MGKGKVLCTRTVIVHIKVSLSELFYAAVNIQHQVGMVCKNVRSDVTRYPVLGTARGALPLSGKHSATLRLRFAAGSFALSR